MFSQTGSACVETREVSLCLCQQICSCFRPVVLRQLPTHPSPPSLSLMLESWCRPAVYLLCAHSFMKVRGLFLLSCVICCRLQLFLCRAFWLSLCVVVKHLCMDRDVWTAFQELSQIGSDTDCFESAGGSAES